MAAAATRPIDMRKGQWVSDQPVGLLMPASLTARVCIEVVRTIERNTRFSLNPGFGAADVEEHAPGTAGHDLPFVLWHLKATGEAGFADLTLTIRAACNGTFVYNGRTMSPIACHCLALTLYAQGLPTGPKLTFTCSIDSGRYVSRQVAKKMASAGVASRCPLFSCAGSALPPVPAHYCVTGPSKIGQKEVKRREEAARRRQCGDPGHRSDDMQIISNGAIAMTRRNRRFIPRCAGCPDFEPRSCSKSVPQAPAGTHRGLSVKLLAGHLQARIRDDPKRYDRYGHIKAHYDGVFVRQTPRMLSALAACSAVEMPVAPTTKTQVLLAVGARFATSFLPAVLASRLECTDVMACVFSYDVIRGIIAADRPSKKRCIFADTVLWDILFGTGFGSFPKETVVGGVCRSNFFNYVAPDLARGIPGKEAAKADLGRETGQSAIELSRVVTERAVDRVYGDMPDRYYYDETLVQLGCGLAKGLIEVAVCFTGSASNAREPDYALDYGDVAVDAAGGLVDVRVQAGELLTWPTLRHMLQCARRETEDIPGKSVVRLSITANLKRTYAGCDGHLLPHHFATLFARCFSDPAAIKADPVHRKPVTGSALATLCMMSASYPSQVSISALREEFHADRLHPATEDCPEVKKRAALILAEAPDARMAVDVFFEAPSMMGRAFVPERFEKLVAVLVERGNTPAAYGGFGRIAAVSYSRGAGDDRESDASASSSSFSARLALASAHRKRKGSAASRPTTKKSRVVSTEGSLNAAMIRFLDASIPAGAAPP